MLWFNMDLAEGAGIEHIAMPFLNQANIACGAHAGNESIMNEAVLIAADYKVEIGAHPGYEDKVNFGRHSLGISTAALKESIYSQVCTLMEICAKHNTDLKYIKPHGALYHEVCQIAKFSELMIELMINKFPKLALMGLPNCEAFKNCQVAGIKFIREGFADRRYNQDGSLVNRAVQGAILSDPDLVLNQVRSIINDQKVIAINKEIIALEVDSLCFHGDHEGALSCLKFTVNKLKNG